MTTKRRAEEEEEDRSVTHVPPYEGQEMAKWRSDSCWSWLVCFASGLSVAIVAGVNYSFGLLLPSLMENFEETRQAAGKGSRDAYKIKNISELHDTPCLCISSDLTHSQFKSTFGPHRLYNHLAIAPTFWAQIKTDAVYCRNNKSRYYDHLVNATNFCGPFNSV